MFTADMNPLDLTLEQLKRATSIKERIADLNNQLAKVLGISAKSGAAAKKNRTLSASVRNRIATAQKARWAKVRDVKPATRSAKPAAKKKRMSPAARAKLSAKLKAYWAAKRTGKK
jgi:thiaminase